MLRSTRGCFLIALLSVAPALAQGQNEPAYPTQTIEIVVPAAAGGPTDIGTRVLAEFLKSELNSPVAIDNRAGAGGNTGSAYVARANPTGYLLLSVPDSIASNVVLYKNTGFDLLGELTPIAMYGTTSPTVLVRPQLGAKSMKELLEIGRTRSEPLKIGNPGVGTTGHLLSQYWQAISGIKWVDVPYRGGGPAVVDLLGGQIDAFIGPVPAGLIQVKAGALLSLGVMAPARLRELPNVPTAREQGIAELETANWIGLFAPAQTPQPIITKLSKTVERFTADPHFAQLLGATGFDAKYAGPAEFRDIATRTVAKWGEVFKRAGLSQM
jgi:tripartite-type tricarboxylate transporter receptor subunit TctC